MRNDIQGGVFFGIRNQSFRFTTLLRMLAVILVPLTLMGFMSTRIHLVLVSFNCVILFQRKRLHPPRNCDRMQLLPKSTLCGLATGMYRYLTSRAADFTYFLQDWVILILGRRIRVKICMQFIKPLSSAVLVKQKPCHSFLHLTNDQ